MNWATCPGAQIDHPDAALQIDPLARRWVSFRTCCFPGSWRGPRTHTGRQTPVRGRSPAARPPRCARPVSRSTVCSWPVPDSSTQSRPPCTRGECGIDRPRLMTAAAGHIDEDAAVGLRRPPAFGGGGFSQGRDVARLAAGHRQAIQVAVVAGDRGGKERRVPARERNCKRRPPYTGRRRRCSRSTARPRPRPSRGRGCRRSRRKAEEGSRRRACRAAGSAARCPGRCGRARPGCASRGQAATPRARPIPSAARSRAAGWKRGPSRPRTAMSLPAWYVVTSKVIPRLSSSPANPGELADRKGFSGTEAPDAASGGMMISPEVVAAFAGMVGHA